MFEHQLNNHINYEDNEVRDEGDYVLLRRNVNAHSYSFRPEMGLSISWRLTDFNVYVRLDDGWVLGTKNGFSMALAQSAYVCTSCWNLTDLYWAVIYRVSIGWDVDVYIACLAKYFKVYFLKIVFNSILFMKFSHFSIVLKNYFLSHKIL